MAGGAASEGLYAQAGYRGDSGVFAEEAGEV